MNLSLFLLVILWGYLLYLLKKKKIKFFTQGFTPLLLMLSIGSSFYWWRINISVYGTETAQACFVSTNCRRGCKVKLKVDEAIHTFQLPNDGSVKFSKKGKPTECYLIEYYSFIGDKYIVSKKQKDLNYGN